MRQSIGIVLVMQAVVLTGCSSTQLTEPSFRDDAAFRTDVATALKSGHTEAARERLADALRSKPNDGQLHLLTGLSYQMEGNFTESMSLAKVGYDAAVKFAPGNYWSHYLAGSVAFDLQNYKEAAEHFSMAILDDPERVEGFLGLAAAAYFARDLGVASAASRRALSLSPKCPLTLRSAAFVAAAQGDGDRFEELRGQAESSKLMQEFDESKPRLSQLLRNAATKVTAVSMGQGAEPDPAPAQDLKQVMVEVTLLLNQTQTGKTTGINLLDGLTMQFGAEQLTTKTYTTGLEDTSTRVFTTAIRVPQLTYSLNLFNTKTDYYRVIARPSLVAYLDEPSDFFIGRTVSVAVSGVNLGSIAPVDVGISVKVTPYEITPERGKFKVEVIRSFFSQETGGTFEQSLTTFKQTVSGTAEVDFGKTLILSGLYEAVETGTSSKVPGLGDIPGVKTFFNARKHTERRDVAMVLVTPRLAGSINTGTREFRGETLSKLLAMWKEHVDPVSNMDTIIGTIGYQHEGSTLFTPKPGDVRMPAVTRGQTFEAVIDETMAQMR